MIRAWLTTAIAPAIVAIALAGGCERFERRREEPPPKKPVDVQVLTVTPRDVPIDAEWVATLDGYINATISAQVTGYLISQNYREGSYVRKGDVLFEIDPRPFQAAVDQAKGELERAQAELGKAVIDVNRYTPLAAEGAISQQELDDAVQAKLAAEAQVAASQGALDNAYLNLGFTKVTALIDGIAGIANAQVGDLVGPSTGQLTVVSSVDPIKAYVMISEQDYLSKIAASGTLTKAEASERAIPFTLILSTGKAYEHPGTFSFVGREVNVRTGTLTMVVEFPNPDRILRPGQFGRVRAVVRTAENALVVPQRAVRDLQGTKQLAIVGKDDTISIRNVTTGPRVGSDWIITDGLKPGETVVVEGIQKVRDGVKVAATPYKPAAAPETGSARASGSGAAGAGSAATHPGSRTD